GSWSATIEFNNVPVHVSLLPNGKLLYWGRRKNPKADTNDNNLNEKETKAFPKSGDISTAGRSEATKNDPLAMDNKTTVNLFCGGHCFLPDGKLLIVGGHVRDGQGIDQACLYDFEANTFRPLTKMVEGRWYPSALPLPDGRVLVMSGALSRGGYAPNPTSQIFTNPVDPLSTQTPWKEVISSLAQSPQKVDIGPGALALYPRLHLTPKGRIFMAGPNPRAWFLDVKDDKGAEIQTEILGGAKLAGRWEDTKIDRDGKFRDYAPSVMYDRGKVMYMGGGQDENKDLKIPVLAPTTGVEFIDLNVEPLPKWTQGPNMTNARRQFNATILPDGTVLVTGGTSGPGFNDLGKAVHVAELFDPYAGTKGTWTTMAEESWDRCYHSVALLLPDGRVMSAGGGEYGENLPAATFCFPNAQFFEPPYLHKAAITGRPVIKSFPKEITYSQETFAITLESANDTIDKISWVRIGSVTHCRNMNQSLIWLQKKSQTGASLTIAPPENANVSPPGHYMLFVLKKGIPSVGKIMRISAPATTTKKQAAARMTMATPAPPEPTIQPTLAEHNDALMAERGHPPVSVGITPVCPYGLGPCWGGAYDGLLRMSDVDVVCPLAHQEDSTAHVYLADDSVLPDIDKWRKEFSQTVNASYDMRGIEMTLSGVLGRKGDHVLTLVTNVKELLLAPYKQASQIRWDYLTKAPRPVTDAEVAAYKRLEEEQGKGSKKVQVTGTLQKLGEGKFSLDVRDF
ncbi:hypothetical protein B0H66DRAFT_620679, partial [Apodospora peruviana]